MIEKYTKYEIKVKGIEWILYRKHSSGYTKLFMLNDDKEKIHLHAVDVDSCLQYIWKYYNQKTMKFLTQDDLTFVEEFEKDEERLA